jgi:hypothetical protein
VLFSFELVCFDSTSSENIIRNYSFIAFQNNFHSEEFLREEIWDSGQNAAASLFGSDNDRLLSRLGRDLCRIKTDSHRKIDSLQNKQKKSQECHQIELIPLFFLQ